MRPGTFGKIKVGSRECPKSPVEKQEIRSDPISVDPSLPPLRTKRPDSAAARQPVSKQDCIGAQ